MLHILLLEDDPLISKSLKISLNYQGFAITICNTLGKAIELHDKDKFDLFILDINLPDGNGLEFCEYIRKSDDLVPIIMLTAKADEETAVRGITLGADDYIRKPFGVKELVVRINRLLDRKAKTPRIISYKVLKMDLDKRLVWAESAELTLGKREFDILRLLIQKQGDVTSRDDILSTLGEDAAIYDRTIDSHLSHLRKKLRDVGANHIHITPVYGVGYRLEEK